MTKNVDFEERSRSFLKWFDSQPGTTFHPALEIVDLRDRGAGRGIIVTTDIPPETDLFTIPRSTIISEETSELTKKLPELLSSSIAETIEDDEASSDFPKSWLNLILILLYESFHHTSSIWSPYLSVLPQSPSSFNTLMFWSHPELSELQASAMSSKIGKDSADRMFKERIIPVINKHANIFYPASIPHVSDEELLVKCHIMGSLIMSYAFDLQPDEDSDDENSENEDGWTEDRSKPSTMGMVPMADMLNADAEFNAHLSHGEDSLTMTSLREIKAGEEVLNYYGPLPNGELLRRYGYTSPKHIRYDVVEVDWKLVREVLLEEEPLKQVVGGKDHIEKAVADIEQDEDHEAEVQDGFILEREAGDPNEQGLCITEARFVKFPDELVAIISDLMEKLLKDDTRKRKLDADSRNKVVKSEMLEVLKAIVSKRTKQYATSIAEDEDLLAKADMKGRLRMAIEVRLGEKRLLAEVLMWTEGMLEKYQGRSNGHELKEPPPGKKQKHKR